MEIAKIHSKYTDTGHWMARSNHDTGLIELNRRDFPHLSPMTQDYIWVHEWVHLVYDIYDEAQCNEIADKIFVSRAKTDAERREREEFVKDSYGTPYSSGIAVTAIVGIATTVISLGVKAYQVFGQAKEGSGYYGLSSGDRYLLVKDLVNGAFAAAVEQGGVSPQAVFWAHMSQCSGVESDYSSWLANNGFAKGVISQAEAAYGRSFDKVVPVRFWSKPVVKYSLIALAVIAAVLVFVKLRKTKKI